MKTRESGMPDEETWRSFFDAEAILDALGFDENVQDAVDFGCGYGTFALPAAQRIRGTMHGIDIDPAMIDECARRARICGIDNLQLHVRDFVEKGTGLADDAFDYAMLFNILHAEQPSVLLREAWRILKPGARLAVIHWNHDPATPRGPSMEIRPRPNDCRQWMEQAGFAIEGGPIDLPPWHYGLVGRRLVG